MIVSIWLLIKVLLYNKMVFIKGGICVDHIAIHDTRLLRLLQQFYDRINIDKQPLFAIDLVHFFFIVLPFNICNKSSNICIASSEKTTDQVL